MTTPQARMEVVSALLESSPQQVFMGHPRPNILGGVPTCSREDCPEYDGKRCQLLGTQPSSICEPAVAEMAAELVLRTDPRLDVTPKPTALHFRAERTLDAVKDYASAAPWEAEVALEGLNQAAAGWRNTGFPVVDAAEKVVEQPPTLSQRIEQLDEKIDNLDSKVGFDGEHDDLRFESIGRQLDRLARDLAEVRVLYGLPPESIALPITSEPVASETIGPGTPGLPITSEDGAFVPAPGPFAPGAPHPDGCTCTQCMDIPF